jgi:hypothetical protein
MPIKKPVQKIDATFIPERQIHLNIPDSLKRDLKSELASRDIPMTHIITAFMEQFVAYSKGEKNPDVFESIIRRAQSLKTRG